MSECLIYQLKPGKTVVGRITMVSGRCLTTSLQIGRLDSVKPAAIRLSGESIREEHCYFENNDGKVTLHAMPDAVTVSTENFPPLFLIPNVTLVLERSANYSRAGS